MTLKKYFEAASGTGVLATADAGGKVDAAIDSTPHVMEDGPGYNGLRLYLKKIGEDANPELIASMTRRHLKPELDAQKGPKHLVYFVVEKILPLIGSGAAPVTP
jgi:hypothetical protein